ncbi:MAG TPA: glutamate--tRNA ligase family protein [Kofleriaceae bacterium]|nr:glutamate--tRNA ligase family protein [Kofleriaceae bacterium]
MTPTAPPAPASAPASPAPAPPLVRPPTGRFAPSTTGLAHPGTLLSALLVWLDARALGGRALLRLENLDVTRCQPGWADAMIDDLAWLGLDWDDVVEQSSRRADHEAALDALAAAGRLYPCGCSRRDREDGRRAPDGSWAYANTCRGRALPAGGWRAAAEPVRARLDDGRLELVDDGGLDLSQDPAAELGDPVVVRRDGVVAYQLAVVVDDHGSGVDRVVRGRDIAPSTATQVALQRLLGWPAPRYRHHLLLLAAQGDKLAKLHGSIPATILRARHRGDELCGLLAGAIGLRPDAAPCTPRALLADFDWARVTSVDLVARWEDGLVIEPPESGTLPP